MRADSRHKFILEACFHTKDMHIKRVMRESLDDVGLDLPDHECSQAHSRCGAETGYLLLALESPVLISY